MKQLKKWLLKKLEFWQENENENGNLGGNIKIKHCKC